MSSSSGKRGTLASSSTARSDLPIRSQKKKVTFVEDPEEEELIYEDSQNNSGPETDAAFHITFWPTHHAGEDHFWLDGTLDYGSGDEEVMAKKKWCASALGIWKIAAQFKEPLEVFYNELTEGGKGSLGPNWQSKVSNLLNTSLSRILRDNSGRMDLRIKGNGVKVTFATSRSDFLQAAKRGVPITQNFAVSTPYTVALCTPDWDLEEPPEMIVIASDAQNDAAESLIKKHHLSGKTPSVLKSKSTESSLTTLFKKLTEVSRMSHNDRMWWSQKKDTSTRERKHGNQAETC